MKQNFFSGKGDQGSTGLLGAGRVMKSDPQIEALGALDEATAALGLARSLCDLADVNETVLQVQRDLYELMGEVAATPENVSRFHNLTQENLAWLESRVEAFGKQVEIPAEFIVPGDSPLSAFFNLARTVVRRAERQLVRLGQERAPANPELILAYVNRLSTLCYMLELYVLKAGSGNPPTLVTKE